MRLRTTKVFVDSRYAAIGTSGSSILFEIPGGVELGPNARCFVSEFTCVCAWPTLDDTNRHQSIITSDGFYVLSLQMPYRRLCDRRWTRGLTWRERASAARGAHSSSCK